MQFLKPTTKKVVRSVILLLLIFGIGYMIIPVFIMSGSTLSCPDIEKSTSGNNIHCEVVIHHPASYNLAMYVWLIISIIMSYLLSCVLTHNARPLSKDH